MGPWTGCVDREVDRVRAVSDGCGEDLAERLLLLLLVLVGRLDGADAVHRDPHLSTTPQIIRRLFSLPRRDTHVWVSLDDRLALERVEVHAGREARAEAGDRHFVVRRLQSAGLQAVSFYLQHGRRIAIECDSLHVHAIMTEIIAKIIHRHSRGMY